MKFARVNEHKTRWKLCFKCYAFASLSTTLGMVDNLIVANDASPQLGVSLENCTFLNNSIPGNTSSSVLSFILIYIIMAKSIVGNSNGTAVFLYDSNLNLCDSGCVFENSHAKYSL